MSKKNIISELETEKTATEQKIKQFKHRNERLNNRICYLNKDKFKEEHE